MRVTSKVQPGGNLFFLKYARNYDFSGMLQGMIT